MKKSTILIAVAVIALAALGGFMVFSGRSDDNSETTTPESTSDTQESTQPSDTSQTQETTPSTNTDNQPAEKTEVEIKDFAFRSASITVKKGTTVTWTNKDSVQHSVVPDTESNAFDGSELLAKDASYSFTFSVPGTYAYHCGPHPNMTGTVTVTE
ncbi:MAG TPA: cupredoxin family copper-binding protein [Candidatus Limnocylindria bacterium]|nr:cupredoxin family copper-binding protein [Candidatus Limnocylindria bacterium]